MKIAIPLTGGQLSTHFGHCEQFGIYEVEDGKIIASKLATPRLMNPVCIRNGCMNWASM